METYIVDSFTNEIFKGNPAGVCLVEKQLDESKMLLIAAELGFSETAFVIQPDGRDHYAIRYFSPKMEIPLCGHATLAASKALFEKLNLQNIHFITSQNIDLHIQKSGEEIIMEFPVYDTHPAHAPEELLSALELDKIINCEYNQETNILLLEIDSGEKLRSLAPDFEKLIRSHDSIHGVLVTAVSAEKNYDFESRFFWPWSGTNEDPVTGGSHTFLTGYWAKRLNKTRLNSFQCSKRMGFMEVELINENKLTIKSCAKIVFKGVFLGL